MEVRHTIQRELNYKQIHFRLFQRILNCNHYSLGEVAIGWHIYLAHTVLAHKLARNFGELIS